MRKAVLAFISLSIVCLLLTTGCRKEKEPKLDSPEHPAGKTEKPFKSQATTSAIKVSASDHAKKTADAIHAKFNEYAFNKYKKQAEDVQAANQINISRLQEETKKVMDSVAKIEGMREEIRKAALILVSQSEKAEALMSGIASHEGFQQLRKIWGELRQYWLDMAEWRSNACLSTMIQAYMAYSDPITEKLSHKLAQRIQLDYLDYLKVEGEIPKTVNIEKLKTLGAKIDRMEKTLHAADVDFITVCHQNFLRDLKEGKKYESGAPLARTGKHFREYGFTYLNEQISARPAGAKPKFDAHLMVCEACVEAGKAAKDLFANDLLPEEVPEVKKIRNDLKRKVLLAPYDSSRKLVSSTEMEIEMMTVEVIQRAQQDSQDAAAMCEVVPRLKDVSSFEGKLKVIREKLDVNEKIFNKFIMPEDEKAAHKAAQQVFSKLIRVKKESILNDDYAKIVELRRRVMSVEVSKKMKKTLTKAHIRILDEVSESLKAHGKLAKKYSNDISVRERARKNSQVVEEMRKSMKQLGYTQD
ncbi:hypothetical protein ACFL1X_11975 [Candidatus Hydrogenedentota bacterium]